MHRLIRKTRKILDKRFAKRQGTLIYVGLYKGGSFEEICYRFEKCYGFEANPKHFALLKEKFHSVPSIQLFNMAAAETTGHVTFNISSNDGRSSSIGTLNPHWPEAESGRVMMTEQVTIPSVNLCEFCDERGIEFVDEYVSDIQGMDYAVLRTLKPLIDARRIGRITCEVCRSDKEPIYEGIPPNTLENFSTILSENYELSASGWGILKDGQKAELKDDVWEMDCMWRLKS